MPAPVRASVPEARKSGRPSHPDVVISRGDGEATQHATSPVLNEARKPGRASKTAAEEVTKPSPPPEGMDAWPMQDLTAEELDEWVEEKTRIGAPAYTAAAKAAPPAEAREAGAGAPLRPAQAVRVVVWRSADGVRVAPHGTTVSAISVDAMLVALDPSADLAAWLTKG
jgi:hypothetical protein